MVNDMVVRLTPSLNDSQIGLLFTVSIVCALLVNLGLENAQNLSSQTNSMLKSLRLKTFKTIVHVIL